MAPIPILFIETGNQGGGSFGSLCQHLKGINRAKFEPIVVFFVPNKYTRILDGLKIEYHILSDWYYPENPARRHFGRMLRWRKRVFGRWPRWTIALLRVIHWPTLRKLNRMIARRGVRLIHLNDTVYRDMFGVILARRHGLPCVSHLRSTNSGDFNAVMRDWANRHVDQFMTVSDATRRYWVGLGLEAEKVDTVYNGIDVPNLVPRDVRREFDIGAQFSHVIGVVAMLLDIKGHAFLFRSFALPTAATPGRLPRGGRRRPAAFGPGATG